MRRPGDVIWDSLPRTVLGYFEDNLWTLDRKRLLFSGFLQQDEGLETLLFSLALQLQNE